ncbi:hypothetical protein ACLB2K_004749 [Fragaria x ananassa]
MTVSFQQPPPPQSQPQPQPEKPPQPQPQQPPQPQRMIRKLIVEVVDARDLLPKDGQGSSSAHVVADFDGQRKRTATKYKDLNPVWNEPLEFVVSDPDNMDYEEPSIEVKPGKPFTHKPGDYNGRLHISMIFELSLRCDSGSGSEEEFLAKKKPQKGKAHHRRLKKTYLISDSDMECENENDNSRPISSLFKTKLSTDEDATQEREEKIDKGTVDTSNEKAVDDFSTESIRHVDDVLLDGQMKRQLDVPVAPCSIVDLDNGGKPKRKRKERLQEEKKLEADVLKKENEPQKIEAKAENRSHNGQLTAVNHSGAEMPDDLSLPSTEVGPGNSDKPKICGSDAN